MVKYWETILVTAVVFVGSQIVVRALVREELPRR